MFLPHPRVKVSIVGSLRDREVACSASDRQGSNFESCVWRTVSSQSSHHPQEVLLAQFSLYVHKGGLKPDSFHFIFSATIKLILATDEVLITTLKVITATTKVILSTEEVIIATLNVISATTKVILATEEVITATLKVISAIAKVILVSNKLLSATNKIT